MPLIINGETIEEGLVEQEFSAIKAYHESLGNVSCCERDGEFRSYARENVISRVLLAQEAERTLPPTPDAEVDVAIEQIKREHGGESAFVAATGIQPGQEEMFRVNVETNIRLQKFVQSLTAGDAQPTDADLRKYYEDHLDAFKTVEEVRVSHILKAPKKSEEREKAFRELRGVREELLNGADFGELAKKHSDKPENETDLGFFKRGEIMEEFELVAFSLRVGEVSPVFGSAFGFHLVKLTDRKPSVPKPFEEVRDEVRQRLLAERSEKKIKEKAAELRATAKIEDGEANKACCGT